MYDQETDRRALTALFNATAGAGWRDSRGWMEKLDDIQTWFGVSVNDSGRVNAVLLPRNDLNGNVPPEIWDLDELERLGLGDNLIKGNLPSIPENRMKKLVYFSVGTNQITGTLPDLHLLPNLKEAVLDKNKFTGELPRSIGRCKKLERLWIFSNKLTGKLPSELGNLTNMKKLDISDNLFSGAIPEECTKMTKLMEFKIRGNSGLTKPGIPRISSSFDRWTENQGLDVYLKGLKYSYESMEIPDEPGGWEAFQGKKGQVVLPEVPFKSRDDDRLGFADYADVLAKRLQNPTGWPVGIGIYAQWGAGKSSLCEMIIQRLEDSDPKMQTPWFIRWLWTTTWGAALYALTLGIITAVSGKRCISVNTNGGYRPVPTEADKVEREAGTSDSRIISIIARFDAWLFADSKVLWAVLVSKVFEKVEECFGKGAVRATRVQHAVLSSTCIDWCTVVFTIIFVVCVAAATEWVAEQIKLLEKQAERAVASVALLGVPLGIVLCMIKALPVVFKSQGQIILSKAEAIGESVGTAHLGFMADVQEEMQVLLGMLKSKSSEDKKYLLVISIDNLDRCPHRQIVKVLEAVHLLLEYIEVNVVVILALDPRMVIAAVEKDMGDEMCREVSGSEYLDKIIHWPFCIPASTKEERTSLLHSWLRRPFHQTSAVRDNDGANTREGPVEAKTSEESVLDDGEPQSSPGRHTSPSVPPEEAGDVRDNAGGNPMSPLSSSEAAASGRDQVSQDDSLSHLGRQTSYLAHTLDEVEEMENITKFATTPRKAKRVFNIYSIQRELAEKRGAKTGYQLSKDDARKLLRWTILSEFWPFHTACLAAVIQRVEADDEWKPHSALHVLFINEGEKFMKKIFDDLASSMGNRFSRHRDNSNASYSQVTARRLMGMDGEYADFYLLLKSKPCLVLEDFDERRLGLLRLSINLSPAMVARVTSWDRSRLD